jgi:hypothetical protein
MDRMTKLIEVIGKLIDGEVTGYIKINFTQGSLGRIEKFEEIDDAVIAVKEEKKNKKEKEEEKVINHETK